VPQTIPNTGTAHSLQKLQFNVEIGTGWQTDTYNITQLMTEGSATTTAESHVRR